jgi:hypothetical protein
MIIGNLKGGLGNQLFIYSFIYTLAKNFTSNFNFDLTDFNYDIGKKLEINKFEVNLKEYNKVKLNKFRRKSISSIHEKFKRKIGIDYFKKNIISEQSFIFDEFKQNYNKNLDFYMDGYWQDIKYFITNQKELNKQFSVKKSFLSDSYKKLENEIIQNKSSICLHIRKGDYLNKINKTIYENISLNYYFNSLSYFKTYYPNSIIYIFSDDVEWIYNNFDTSNFKIISDYKLNTIEEFNLMTKFTNIITSNSTFSLWASLLNNHEKKNTIVPKFWFKKENANKTSKLFTKQMVILEN